MAYLLDRTGATADAELDKAHDQNTDTSLDLGGSNPVTAAELVTLKDTTVPAKVDKVTIDENNVLVANGSGGLKDGGTIEEILYTSLPIETAGGYGFRYNPHDDTFMELGASNGSPVQDDMKRCLLKNADATLDTSLAGGGYLDDDDSTLFADGVTDASTYINGSNNHQVHVQIPKAYTALYNDHRGHTYFWCAEKPIANLALHPAFTIADVVKDYRYIGAYQSVRYADGVGYGDGTGATRPANLTNDYVGSVSGLIPLTYQYRSDFRTLTDNIGTGFWQWDWQVYDLMRMLFFTDKATRSAAHPFNSQAIIPGHTEESSWDFAKILANGLTNVLGNASGSVEAVGTAGKAANSFRGIENFFGSIWQWVDGFNVLSHIPYYCTDPDAFADDTTTNYARFVDQFGNPITLPTSNNYQKYLWPGTLLPIEVGGNDASSMTDYFWQNTGNNVLLVGGSLSNAGLVGVSVLLADHNSSSAAAVFGSRSAA